MYYLQSRYYDANAGRFINGDEPIFTKSNNTKCNSNLFTYCYNSSTLNNDPLGYEVLSASAIVAIIVCSIVVLVYMIWLVSSILNDKNFQKCLNSALKNVDKHTAKHLECIAVALIAAYALAHTRAKNSKRELHHIVAQKAARAVYARTILIAVKISVNSEVNTASIKYNLHRRLHTNIYYDSVNAAVITAYGSANTSSRKKTAVMSVLAGIKVILLGLSRATP